jgi:NAD(P)-dependent dehydrogenase (short-subunit alcohol dehydrogenase family)
MSKPRWTARDLPSLSGKIIVVTGANGGIGFEAAQVLAGAGGHVILACRNQTAAAAAKDRILAAHPGASLAVAPLDLASLASVRAFAESFLRDHDRLDVLVNNAGVMALPYCKTADGFEMQFGTNHLGHFALTALLFDRLAKSAPSRVVTVSSQVHLYGWMRWKDLQWEKGYQRWLAYGQSKIANLLFSHELHRRITARGLDVRSVACHPGYAATNLQLAGSRMEGSKIGEGFWNMFNTLFGQSAEMGGLPTAFAAGAPEAQGGDYIGPGGLFTLRGNPTRQRSNRRSRDEASAKKLWTISEELTRVSFAP